MEEMKTLTADMQSRYAALQAEQEAVHQRLTEAAIAAMGSAVEARVATLDERVSATLAVVESRLPNTLREGVQEGLAETVQMVEALREQTAEMAHTLGQISGNADRQLQAYERWNDRALSVQARLEQGGGGRSGGTGRATRPVAERGRADSGRACAPPSTARFTRRSTALPVWSPRSTRSPPNCANCKRRRRNCTPLSPPLPPTAVTLPAPPPPEVVLAPAHTPYDISPAVPGSPGDRAPVHSGRHAERTSRLGALDGRHPS